MNSITTRTLVRTIGWAGLSVPLALGITLGAAGAAHADQTIQFVPANPEPVGPGDIAVADNDDECDLHDICLPEEDPTPNPDLPQGPGDITLPEEDPEGPGDINNPDDDNDPEVPEGPGDLTNGPDCTHGCGDEGDGGQDDGGTTGGFDTPERIDAGDAGDASVEFGWILPSGLIVAAAGAAYAARRRLA